MAKNAKKRIQNSFLMTVFKKSYNFLVKMVGFIFEAWGRVFNCRGNSFQILGEIFTPENMK